MLNSRGFYYTLRVLPYFMLIEALFFLIPSLYESFRLGPIGLYFRTGIPLSFFFFGWSVLSSEHSLSRENRCEPELEQFMESILI